jgi:uncharacterized membrane protein YqjE
MTENNEAGRGGSAGLFASLRNFAATAVAIARTRLELLANEMAEEKIRLSQLVVFGVVALFGLVIGTIFLAVFVTVLFWDSHRLIALGGFAVLFLGMGAYAAIQFRTRAVAGSGLFSASLAELDKDRQQLSP